MPVGHDHRRHDVHRQGQAGCTRVQLQING
jgi:hypothetical protein